MRFIERNTRTAYRIEGLRREDVPEYPMQALREAITNAVMHREWFFDGANVFVEVYTDRIEVSSPGGLPKGLTLADLGHRSIRRNALIADLLHRIGFIEKAGTGIRRIRDEASEMSCPEPEFRAGSFMTVTFRPNPEVRAEGGDRLAGGVAPEVTSEVAPEVTEQVTWEVTGEVTGEEIRLLRAMSGEMTRQRIQEALGLKHEDHFRHAYLLPALRAGLIEMTIPDKPRSSKQRYRLTPAGSEYLKQIGEGRQMPKIDITKTELFSLADQVVATALMLCLADRVETRQGDPRQSTRDQESRRQVVSCGNRLFCDAIGSELRHRWGSAKLYRDYYQD